MSDHIRINIINATMYLITSSLVLSWLLIAFFRTAKPAQMKPTPISMEPVSLYNANNALKSAEMSIMLINRLGILDQYSKLYSIH